MGYLLHLLLALIAQGLSEAGWTTGWRLPWLALVLCGVPHALAWASQRLFLRGRFRSSALLLRALSGCAPALHLCALSLFGWMHCLRAWLGEGISLAAWPNVGLLLALLPFVVYELASIDARARISASTGRERRAWRLFQSRMLLSGLVPLAGYVLISAAAGASETLRIEIEEVSLFGAAFAGGLLALLALFLPALLRNVWDTSTLPPGVQRDLLLSVASRAGFRARALLAWNTGNLMANAAIVGLGPHTRIVLFSDSLLSQLEGPELAAVFAHEIGHAVRRHVLIFVAWAAAFFLISDLVANHLFADSTWHSGVFVLAAVVAWLLAFGYMSRRFELEADLFCLDLLGDATGLIRALEKIGGRFRDVASWRHFSTAERVRFLESAAADPSVGARLRGGLRRWTRVGVALLVVTAALQAWALGRSFPEDRLRADLRLGRYAVAGARAARLEGIDPHLAALVARASSLGGDHIPVEELGRRARTCMLGADAETGLAWLELASLRGSPDLDAVAGALRGLIEHGTDAREALEGALYDSWRGEFEACRTRPREQPPPGGQ
jgi:hypothetical protein